MSRPLIESKGFNTDERKFHREVKADCGGVHARCVFCGCANPTDAAHIISRTKLGVYRFADKRLARMACRSCHQQQTGTLRWSKADAPRFPDALVCQAYYVHNVVLETKSKLVCPVCGKKDA